MIWITYVYKYFKICDEKVQMYVNMISLLFIFLNSEKKQHSDKKVDNIRFFIIFQSLQNMFNKIGFSAIVGVNGQVSMGVSTSGDSIPRGSE